MIVAVAAMVLASASPSGSFEALLGALVETDTTSATGSCTMAAAKAEVALRAGGIDSDEITEFGDPKHPKERGLLAHLPGRDRTKQALLLVAHIDTVPADATEWVHPPFRLTEDRDYLYGRGVADNKAVAALLVELLVDLRRAPERPIRTVAIALTCGEETPDAFNGAQWLASQRHRLIDPELVLVPSGGAVRGADGRPAAATIAVAEKLQQNFRLEARGTPSHASLPTGDNAIVTLSKGIARIDAIGFPVAISSVVPAQLTAAAARAGARDAAAIETLLDKPDDKAARGVVMARPLWNALLRTTCTTTAIDAGRQANTIAAVAAANINCRILPGENVSSVLATLTDAVADNRLAVTAVPPLAIAAPSLSSPSERVPDELMNIVRSSAGAAWPGSGVTPVMLTGATDARHFREVGIPAYGVTILPYDADGSRVHAADERISVQSIRDGRKLIRALVERLTR